MHPLNTRSQRYINTVVDQKRDTLWLGHSMQLLRDTYQFRRLTRLVTELDNRHA